MKENLYKKKLLKWSKDLFPLNRSLAGKYNRKTISYIKQNINKNFKLKKFKSGKKVFSWKVPNEYNLIKGILKDDKGNIICDIKNNNLHTVTFSTSVNKWLTYKELKEHIFFSDKRKNAIPYVTTYYKKNWGFCISKKTFLSLNKKRKYKVHIDSSFKKGSMNYSEMLIKGKSKKEILICSYICHPSLANNELSGILGICLLSNIIKKNKYSIRLLLIPETIGAISYIHSKFNHLNKNLVAGFNLSCIGIEGPYNVISSISEQTYADKIVKRIGAKYSNFRKQSFLRRGSNERQFGCQNLNLPFVTITRKKFGEYPEYHTSDDNLKILNINTIIQTVNFIKKIVDEINLNKIFSKKSYCEPFLANSNLINNLGTLKNMTDKKRRDISNFLAYVDKSHDLKSLKQKLKISDIDQISNLLKRKKFINEEI